MRDDDPVPVHESPGSELGQRDWSWFLAWPGVCALLSFGLIAMLSIGLLFVVAGTALGAWLAARRPASHRAIWGLVSGAAVPAAFLAWTTRDGPGDVCHSTATQVSCGQQWNPAPFAVAAVLLLATGVALFVVVRSRQVNRARR